jgi:molybdopterin converting factor small subunit
MVSIKVELIGTLQKKQKRRLNITIDGPATVMTLAKRLGIIASSNLASTVGKELKNTNPSILVLVNGVEVSALEGFNTVLEDGASVTFVPVSHGG